MARRLKDAFWNGFYIFVVVVSIALTKLIFRLRIKGRENVHRDEGYIIVARHRSYWDVFLLAAALGVRNRIHFIARKGLMRNNAILQRIIEAYSTVIDRESFGREDFRQMREAIREQRLIGIFPEGTTRRRAGAKVGAIHFANLSDKKILPVNICAAGPYPPKYPFGFPAITISIGEGFSAGSLDGDIAKDIPRATRNQILSDRLMERVDRT